MSLRTYADTGSLRPYFEREQPRARGQETFTDMVKRYTFGYFIKEPYKGWPVVGGLLGLLAGSAFGPLGALFSGALVGSMFLGGASAAYWGWTRGDRKPGNKKWLDGRSVGKYVADNWPREQSQPRTQLNLQYA